MSYIQFILNTIHFFPSLAGINETALSELLSGANNLRSLCLREIQLDDNALYCFSGSSLEMLDISDTKVQRQSKGKFCLFLERIPLKPFTFYHGIHINHFT